MDPRNPDGQSTPCEATPGKGWARHGPRGLTIALAAVLGMLAPVAPAGAGAKAIQVTATPVPLGTRTPDQSSVGRLIYRGGLHLTSTDVRFGGWSALHISAAGRRLMAVSDNAAWLTATLRYDGRGWLVGTEAHRIGRLAGLGGMEIPRNASTADAESLAALPDGQFLVSFERNHRLWRYAPAMPPFSREPEPWPTPPGIADAPNNEGIEALARLADGRLLAIAEGLPAGTGAVAAWLWDGAGWSTLGYAVSGSYRPTAAATLPSGDVVLLERRFNPIDGITARIRRLAIGDISPGAILEAETLATLELPLISDNFEGIATRAGDGEALLYVISDNNFKSFQRTLLLMFALSE
jgi:hypothetical protein